MQYEGANHSISTWQVIGFLLAVTLLLASPANAQQSYVGRWDAYGGFTQITQPSLNLNEPGFNLQVGMRARTWLTLGFDYSIASGQNTLLPGMLQTSLQNTLGAELGQMAALGLVPAGYNLAVPTSTRTQTFEMGPDFPFRKFESVTFFVRPNLGAMQVIATPHPGDPIAEGIVAQLLPQGKKTDWTYFYGFGGGLEFNVNHHFALRVQADFVHDQFFNDLLRPGNTVRFSVGPAFQWGKNIAGQ